MAVGRKHVVSGTRWGSEVAEEGAERPVFNQLVFTDEVARELMDSGDYERYKEALKVGQPMTAEIADAVAAAMLRWAQSRGATHYTHWFQPLTGRTAEKHDSFFEPHDGRAVASFSGRELIQAEPDASSFPSGGLRATFEARGYTAWDPTSPAFLLENPTGATLCIPTAFTSWTGEALDNKIPLLRSMHALSKAAMRALRLFGDERSNSVFTTTGAEQEYFLIPEQFFFERPDLLTTGRTLFGTRPPKGQELNDHYFGLIVERVLACTLDFEAQMTKLGVPIKTRHNEVAPAQYEVAPVFENTNLSCDHQQLVMQGLQNSARRYGLVALLHEKPFAGVNGSGKHNNWSMSTDTGVNLLNPGETPHDNLQFLFFCTAVISAVNRHQGLLRASVASAGNDHRLGADEAPPAIISVYLGALIQDIFDQIERGSATSSKEGDTLDLGSPVLPPLPADAGDRNRTSPLAFVGSRFEFRAPGSSQSISDPNIVLNTIVAEAIDGLSDELEQALAHGGTLQQVLAPILTEAYNANKRIVFNGDGYSNDWHAEAERRGLKNLPTTPGALREWIEPGAIATFAAQHVLSERELRSRYEVYVDQYVIKTNVEAETTFDMAKTMILPAAVEYYAKVKSSGLGINTARGLENAIAELVEALDELEVANLEDNHPGDKAAEADYMCDVVLAKTLAVRTAADRLERIIPDQLWPLPKYREILFIK